MYVFFKFSLEWTLLKRIMKLFLKIVNIVEIPKLLIIETIKQNKKLALAEFIREKQSIISILRACALF